MVGSLEEYAKDHPPKGKCWVCGLSLEVLKQVNEGLKKEIPQATIREWLINDAGYAASDVTKDRLRHHKEGAHHEKNA